MNIASLFRRVSDLPPHGMAGGGTSGMLRPPGTCADCAAPAATWTYDVELVAGALEISATAVCNVHAMDNQRR